MIIECINCSKIFEVNSELIPSSGRTIQCGSCDHIWFYKLDKVPQKESINKNITPKENFLTKKTKIKSKPKLEEKILSKKIDRLINKKDKALIKYEKKSSLTFFNFFGYIIVSIISLIAIIIILDTFKTQLNEFFPNLEIFLFNLYETITDIHLFIKDLIK